MFGSGLESIPLVCNMLWEESSPYRPVRLFPGKEGNCYKTYCMHSDTIYQGCMVFLFDAHQMIICLHCYYRDWVWCVYKTWKLSGY